MLYQVGQERREIHRARQLVRVADEGDERLPEGGLRALDHQRIGGPADLDFGNPRIRVGLIVATAVHPHHDLVRDPLGGRGVVPRHPHRKGQVVGPFRGQIRLVVHPEFAQRGDPPSEAPNGWEGSTV